MGNKMSIEWHEKCLENMKCYMKKIHKDAMKLYSDFLKTKRECEKYQRQINRAIQLNKDGFDRNRFSDK